MSNLRLLAIYKKKMQEYQSHQNTLNSIQQVVIENFDLSDPNATMRREDVNRLIADKLNITYSPKFSQVIHVVLAGLGVRKTRLNRGYNRYRGIQSK